MQSEIFGTICQMGIFIICAQSIVHFRPKAVYEKYLKMLVSVMILIQLFLPVGRLFFGRNAEEFSRRVEEFENSFALSRQEAEENAEQARKRLEQMTLEEVRARLEQEAGSEQGTEAGAASEGGAEQGAETGAVSEGGTEQGAEAGAAPEGGSEQGTETGIGPVEQIVVEIGEEAGK